LYFNYSSAWLDAHLLGLRIPNAWTASLSVGLAKRAYLRPRNAKTRATQLEHLIRSKALKKHARRTYAWIKKKKKPSLLVAHLQRGINTRRRNRIKLCICRLILIVFHWDLISWVSMLILLIKFIYYILMIQKKNKK